MKRSFPKRSYGIWMPKATDSYGFLMDGKRCREIERCSRLKGEVEPTTGFEPATRCLQNSRSTTELRRLARSILTANRAISFSLRPSFEICGCES